MKARLLDRSRDFDWKWAVHAAAEREAARNNRRYARSADFDPEQGLPWNAEVLTADLSLGTMFAAMARDDDWIYEISRRVVLAEVEDDLDTIRYRQEILRDCLARSAVIRELYAVAVEAVAQQKAYFLGGLARHPDSVLREAIESVSGFLAYLRKLRRIAELHAHRFSSEGWTAFFSMLRRDLDDAYFAEVEDHLEVLKFRNGELLGARLGNANKGADYVLNRTPDRRWSFCAWWAGLFAARPPVYHFELPPRDEAGAQALDALRNRGVAAAASALGHSADHVRDFFGMLRAELAFYIGCLNLHDRLAQLQEPLCMPTPLAADTQRLTFRGLYDAGLALSMGRGVVGNDMNAGHKQLVVVTGPNTGGKSTFLRSLGLAQLMMQSGMFVPAEFFCGSLCGGLFTHFKREEDALMESGKLDEELGRMSEIVDHVKPHATVLFNESFAATNEREGSEIARQIISALIESQIRVVCVTHLHELARGFYEAKKQDALFLRAERLPDGNRSFKLVEGEPLGTSFGDDLYRRIFGVREHKAYDDAISPTRAAAG